MSYGNFYKGVKDKSNFNFGYNIDEGNADERLCPIKVTDLTAAFVRESDYFCFAFTLTMYAVHFIAILCDGAGGAIRSNSANVAFFLDAKRP